MDNFVLDNLGGVALENLNLHGLVGDNQVAHRVLLLLIVLILLRDLLLCLLLRLLLQLVLLLLGLLLRLCLLLGGLLLLNQGILVRLLYNNQLLLLLGLSLLTLRLRLALASSLTLFQMLTLVQHEMIFLEEGLTALANMRSHGTTSIGVASIVQQQSMFGRESFAAVAAIVGLGFWLCDDNRLLVLDLLNLCRLLNDLHLLLNLLVLYLLLGLLMLNLYLLWWALWL